LVAPELPRGFVDIHCHVLHGLDDGPQTLDTAFAMCEAAHASGTAAVISTPHANHRFRFDPQRTSECVRELAGRLQSPLKLYSGCELELSIESLGEVWRDASGYTLNGSRYLLIELMPRAVPPSVDRVFERLLEEGIVPIVAHPERNHHLQTHPERLASWVKLGCLTQLTGDSLSGRMGPRVHEAARELLRRRIVHFVASDGHDTMRRPPRLLEAYEIVSQASQALAELVFISNPRAVLEDNLVRAWPAF
jgi:protein-tyrosine phosphatase